MSGVVVTSEKEFRLGILAIIAQCLPKDPPLIPGGVLTIDDLCPNLTEEELAYVMTIYDGNMRRKVV